MVDSTTILLVVITILTGVFVWSRRTYVYWQRRRVKFVRPTHLLGNLKEVLKLENSFALQLRNFYFDKRFENEPLVGIYLFHQPALLLRDLELVRTVLIEDFVSFSNRFAKCHQHQDNIARFNLFFSKNPEWREIRTRLSPVFTAGKIKQMFALMEEIGTDLEIYLNKLTRNFEKHNAPIVQVKDICDLYNTDMIASLAFGFRSYSLRNTQTEIGFHSRQMFMLSFRRAIDFCVIFFLPKFVKLLNARFFAEDHADFLRRTIVSVIKERENSGKMRNDLIEALLTLKKEADLNQDETHFTHQPDYLVAQAAIFEIGGIETSGVMAFALYELAKQPKIQTRLRTEICSAYEACSGSLTYEKVMELQYLNMVVDETLRKYPLLPFLERECTPINKKRFYSFRPHAECYARRGMPVFISNFAIHYDPKYWPNPDLFDPERFTTEQKKTHKPMSYLPFGAGPHNCIGMSIGLLQLKLGLIHFLREHCVEFCEKTVDSIEFDMKFALLSNKDGIYLRIVKCV
ncbi:probable cytochrome P450 6v1 [Teleopsis dalmanni]|uniref:probable cytochrome P450 6v1 n=1 Tax=Teleopsis dalmanni TaxID=139649 RepID=UPI0018CDF86E|nr:probable cytochrome P450 6v1 [Teleopsis dalmanni]XP_037935234.1 probable cytochrome P450 6v1 [Teleopsis dalmanni]XP_037937951.1 probable cytochrome P450 6v1 [Teleopsis dalmanni]XP_037937952.1 probable cytochrome P450 6v1 [Teleopsis dalmanni]